MKWDPYLIPRTVINSKWFKDLNVRPETLKLLDKNIKKKLFGFSLSNNFVNITPKVQATKTKIIKWDYIKLKSFCTAKETINKMKREHMEWEKIFVNHLCNKGQIFIIHNELTQLNSKKNYQIIGFKNGQRTCIDIFSKEDSNGYIATGKFGQHH